MRVTIVGGGNLGLACAARMAAAGLDVTLYTSNPEKWSLDVAVEDCNGQTFFGHLARITEDPKVAADCEFELIYDNYSKLQNAADTHFPLDAETRQAGR